MPTVLLVEDDSAVRDLIAEALAERGLEVRAAADDKAAQRILEREAGQIAVLVADVNLGAGPSGYDVARRARRLNPRMEVIYVTGDARSAECFTVDEGVLCPKPFDCGTLGDMVEALAGMCG